ncbi:MAG: hypothetical protein ACIAQZ_14775 [Sedimentisphaeraceae bacterium JB056]
MSNKQQIIESAVIAPPNLKVAQFKIRGTAPYVQNKFSKKAKEQMHAAQEAGSKSKNRTKKESKDFDACFEQSQHKTPEGWCGIPAPAFRNAMISACRVAGFTMTKAKLSVFVLPDGFDKDDGTPLVKITKGEPRYHESHVRIASGVCDLRARAMWDAGWEAVVTVRWDADQFDNSDIANLLLRVGQQVGVGEGRPDSKQSAGMGWGLFDIV